MGKIDDEKLDIYTKTLSVIDNISKNGKINNTMSYFLFRLACNVKGTIDLEPEDYLVLMKKEYIKNGKITDLGLSLLNDKATSNSEVVNSTLPKLTEETGNIAKRLAKHFLADMFKGNEYKNYNEYCDNIIMAPFFFMFMNMFPSSNELKNVHWDKHFSKWSNVNLRRVTGMTVRNFKKVYKTKDMGLFLLGTYMCIKESYNQEKDTYYVKSLENYWKEYDYWYKRAEEMLVAGQLEQFTKVKRDTNSNNIIII